MFQPILQPFIIGNTTNLERGNQSMPRNEYLMISVHVLEIERHFLPPINIEIGRLVAHYKYRAC